MKLAYSHSTTGVTVLQDVLTYRPIDRIRWFFPENQRSNVAKKVIAEIEYSADAGPSELAHAINTGDDEQCDNIYKMMKEQQSQSTGALCISFTAADNEIVARSLINIVGALIAVEMDARWESKVCQQTLPTIHVRLEPIFEHYMKLVGMLYLCGPQEYVLADIFQLVALYNAQTKL